MKIEWTEPSLSDLENIRDYIRKDSEYYAARFVERIIEIVETLEKFPEWDESFRKPKKKISGNFYFIIIE